MKNDPIFKFVALIVIAGVLIALIDPSQPSGATVAVSKPAAQSVADGAQ